MSRVQIVEVGLRDGLQNEKTTLTVEERVHFASDLIQCGVKRIELGAFVRPEVIPQMRNSSDVIKRFYALEVSRSKSLKPSALVPNSRGLQEALETPIKEISIFASCSEAFSQKNINCSIAESFARFAPVVALAKKRKIRVRGYLSVVFGCPYEGKVSEAQVAKLVDHLYALGCFEISLGDTIGVATPKQVKSLLKTLKKIVPVKALAGHFHDTLGASLANIYESLNQGISTFDSSVGGLGGCPYAKGATGNVATEDVVFFVEKMGMKTGISLEKLVQISLALQGRVGKTELSKISRYLKK